MAHKKAAWSAKNLRDSKPKYRGVKVFGWQKVSEGNIILRQKWNKYEAWENTYMSKDFTIHSNINWVVKFTKSNKARFDGRIYLKTVVNVVTEEVEKAPTKKAATTKKVEEKKAPAKKTTTTKKTEEKKAPAKKPAAKKAPAKKTTAKKETK